LPHKEKHRPFHRRGYRQEVPMMRERFI
jgi:hypothetical protein